MSSVATRAVGKKSWKQRELLFRILYIHFALLSVCFVASIVSQKGSGAAHLTNSNGVSLCLACSLWSCELLRVYACRCLLKINLFLSYKRL